MMDAMSEDLDRGKLCEFACELALAGGRTAAELFGKVGVSRKADDTPVTQADHAAQEAILSALARRHPSHAILVEESVAHPHRHAALADAEYCWVVDPIDGTRNFSRGVRLYATCVAVLHAGQPVAAAVHDAATGQVYWAVLGGGAFCGGAPIRCPDRPIDADTAIAVSSFRHKPVPSVVRHWIDRYLFRSLGSVCLHMVWVAAGLVDATYALECKLWDIAAGALLIEEAGGRITHHDGSPLWPKDLAAYQLEDLPILAGTPVLHATLLADLTAA